MTNHPSFNQLQNPFHSINGTSNNQFIPPYYQQYQYMKQPVLSLIQPWVHFGITEGQRTSFEHALTEVAAVSYLMGKGFDQTTAHLIVESWINTSS